MKGGVKQNTEDSFLSDTFSLNLIVLVVCPPEASQNRIVES